MMTRFETEREKKKKYENEVMDLSYKKSRQAGFIKK
tara:strand:- start:822 stop:929 length:108 start_codon:yes stop_codon:yes gene_type:complete